MTTGRNIRGVLANFLGAYTSRYSDYAGYWLFGFLAGDLVDLRVDLLASPPSGLDGPLDAAHRSATAKFMDQLAKAGLARSQLREAKLLVERIGRPVVRSVNGCPSTGYDLRFTAEAVLSGGRFHQASQVVFVAPHDPKVEFRSARAR